MLINIPEDVAQRLENLAQQRGSSIGDLLDTLLSRYAESSLESPSAPPGSLAELAQNAREANLASLNRVDTADRSREILHNEYTDYLKRRQEDSSDDNHSG